MEVSSRKRSRRTRFKSSAGRRPSETSRRAPTRFGSRGGAGASVAGATASVYLASRRARTRMHRSSVAFGSRSSVPSGQTCRVSFTHPGSASARRRNRDALAFSFAKFSKKSFFSETSSDTFETPTELGPTELGPGARTRTTVPAASRDAHLAETIRSIRSRFVSSRLASLLFVVVVKRWSA